MRNHWLLSVCLLTVLHSLVSAEDWLQFRGSNGTGNVPEIKHPLTWSESENLGWKFDLPGGGLSSPIVVGDRVLITSVIGADLPLNFAGGVSNMRPKRPGGKIKFHVSCISLQSGKLLWEKTLAEERPEHPIHSSNSFATESPASDGENFFVYFASIGKVFGITFDGDLKWEQKIGSFPTGNGFGPGSSITVGMGKVFVQCDNDKRSFLVALDCETGKSVWKQMRNGRTSWSTPLLWRNDRRAELIACGSGYVTSYNPETGKQNWKLSGISSSFSASPAADKTRLYFGNSGPRSSGPLVAVSSSMEGEKELQPGTSGENVVWSKQNAGPGMSSPIVVDGFLYIPSRGILTCYSADTGEQVYKERLKLKSTAASMWGGKGIVFLMDENGKTIAIKSGPKFEVLATSQISDQFWSTPAVAGTSLLLRGVKTLYCVR